MTRNSPTITATAGTSGPYSSVIGTERCSTRTMPSSATMIRKSSRRPCTWRPFIWRRECSAWIATLLRTPTATATSMVRSPRRSRSTAWIAMGRCARIRRCARRAKRQRPPVQTSRCCAVPTDKNASNGAAASSTSARRSNWGADVPDDHLAHGNDKMECYSCHTSWTTSCGGCHLPTEANAKTERHHYEGGNARVYATYNPQVARDDMFMLGRRGNIDGGKIAPVRSSSALVVSSTNANREHIYIQQPPVAASGFSSQAFNPHYPHTERTSETKTCDDCHLSAQNDNNAIMAQLLLQGTNFVNFVGYNAWVGEEKQIAAVQVTEWDEPQAVIGSYLHQYAYPDWFAQHQKRDLRLPSIQTHDTKDAARCLQLRGEYLYVAEGRAGMRVYDVASIANKGISQKILTAPFSPWGQNTHIASSNATCVALPTNQSINPLRNEGELMRVTNLEQPFHPIYSYAAISDSVEGLILVDVNTLADRDPQNNFLTRAMTWNENNILNGARHVMLGGHFAYVSADAGLVIVDLDDPLKPKLAAVVPLKGARAAALQF